MAESIFSGVAKTIVWTMGDLFFIDSRSEAKFSSPKGLTRTISHKSFFEKSSFSAVAV